MPIARASGFPVFTSGTSSVAATWQTVGDLAVLCGEQGGAVGVSSVSVGSSKASWTKVGDYLSSDNTLLSVWIGVITATGADTATIALSSGTPAQLMVDELVGGGAAWTAVANSSLRTAAGTTFNFPSVSSGSNASLLYAYWGIAVSFGGVTLGGSTAGFTYVFGGATNPLLVCLNGGLSTSTAYQPNGTDSASAPHWTVGVVLSVLPGSVLSNVEYAGAAAGLSGGVGSWVNPTNADGVPDSVYATWTAP